MVEVRVDVEVEVIHTNDTTPKRENHHDAHLQHPIGRPVRRDDPKCICIASAGLIKVKAT